MKKWFESKTIWYNLLMMVIEILALAQNSSVFPSSWTVYFVFAQGIVNIILRVWFTTTTIEKSLT